MMKSLPPDLKERFRQALKEYRKLHLLLGEATSLMFQSKLHRKYTVGQLSRRVMPPLKLKQYKIYYDRFRPVGYVSWAWLSDELLQKMETGTYDLTSKEWKTGDNLWIYDMVTLPKHGSKIIMDIGTEIFPDHCGKYIRRDDQGQSLGVFTFYGRNAYPQEGGPRAPIWRDNP